MIKTPSVTMLSARRSCAAVRAAVEARQFADEIVEAPRRGAELAQRNPQRKARRRRPQQQRQMREIAALDEDADQVGHFLFLTLPGGGGSARIERSEDA